MSTESSPEGWHPDPAGHFELRYWDGAIWTEHVWKDGVQSTSALPAPPQPVERVEPEVVQKQPEVTTTLETTAICENGHPLSAGRWECPQCGARIKMQWMDDSDSDSAASPKRAELKTYPGTSSVDSAEPSPGRQGLLVAGWLAAYSFAGLVAWRLCTVILTNGRDEESNLFNIVQFAFRNVGA